MGSPVKTRSSPIDLFGRTRNGKGNGLAEFAKMGNRCIGSGQEKRHIPRFKYDIQVRGKVAYTVGAGNHAYKSITVGYRTFMAAVANPAAALRSE